MTGIETLFSNGGDEMPGKRRSLGWSKNLLSLNVKQSTKSKLKVIQEQVRRLSQRFERALAQKSPAGYLSLLCVGFEIHYEQGYTTRAKDYIMGREVEFRKIQKSLEKYRGMVEEIDRIGEEWKRIDEITSEVRKVVYWIDNLLCSAMVDPADLVNRFHAKQLEFQ
ncbi:hypothetical protein H1R20_g4972, partial [Candolleomyces eurysporus]